MSEEEGELNQYEWHWSKNDQGRAVLLHADKLTVTFHPNGSLGCSAIRGNRPLGVNMQHFFEVEMRTPFHGHARMVGIGTKHALLQTHQFDFYPLLGRDENSWAINYDGVIYHDGNNEEYTRVTQKESLKIGVYYDAHPHNGVLSFEVNGSACGVAFKNISRRPGLELYPIICSSSASSIIKLTQCHSTVMSLKAACRGVIRQAIPNEKNYSKLLLPSYLKAYLAYTSHKPSISPASSETDSLGSLGKESTI